MIVWRESDESLFNHNLNMIFVTTYHLCQFGFNSTDVLREREQMAEYVKKHTVDVTQKVKVSLLCFVQWPMTVW